MKRGAAALGVSVVLVVSLTACTTAEGSRQTIGIGRPRPVEFCGQNLTKPVQEAAEGAQFLERDRLPDLPAPRTSVLPARIDSDSLQLANFSNLLILSRTCARGYTVEVTRSPYLRTVGVAYDHDRVGIVALMLGRLKSAPRPFRQVQVYAFRRNAIVAQARIPGLSLTGHARRHNLKTPA